MKQFILALFLPITCLAANPTPDFYRCSGKVGGEWAFGRAPNACNANDFGSDTVVRSSYGPLIFSDARERTSERNRYMENLHAVIREAAEYYFKKRKPGASKEEMEAFKLGILTTAAQESFWSHYRFTSDNRIKMMRGDFGHGHGIMQVDDRHHFPAVEQGLAWNLLGNITYSMDEYFQNWERAPSQRCVGSASDWEARIRSAWSAYNGGPSRICRWTDPNNRWAHNDRGFYEKLRSKSWKNHVSNAQKTAPIHVPCFMERRENCPPSGTPEGSPLTTNQLYVTPGQEACVLISGRLHCLAYRDRICLKALSNFTGEEGKPISAEQILRFPKSDRDRHSLCRQFEPSLLKAGTLARMEKALNLRATPGGGRVGQLSRGEVTEILDFEIRGITSKNRYYKVRVEGKTGFIYAGNSLDFSSWVKPSELPYPLPKEVARIGESVEIVSEAGINLRKLPGGILLEKLRPGTRLNVEDYEIRGEENHLYYLVQAGAKSGYIYSGALLPTSSVKRWTVRLP